MIIESACVCLGVQFDGALILALYPIKDIPELIVFHIGATSCGEVIVFLLRPVLGGKD